MSTIIDLGKIRFQYRGDYDATSQYEYNDVVRYGGNVYCYINVSATVGNAPGNTTHWALMVSGLAAQGAWDSTTAYQINDVVVHGGSTYRATAATTDDVPPNTSFWEVLVSGYNFRGDWATATAYERDDSVVHLGQSYRAVTNHTSAATFLADLTASPSNWERYAQGTENRSTYATGTDYFKGDLAQNGTGANLDHFICLNDHTSDSTADPNTSPESANWTRLISGEYSQTTADRQYAFFIGLSS